MKPAVAFALLLFIACRQEPLDPMFTVGRARVRRPDHENLCPGQTDKLITGCPEFHKGRFPRHVPAPEVVHYVEPNYPETAKEMRLMGLVVLQSGIRRDGTVAGMCVAKPLPCGLNDAAAEAVKQWRFAPQEEDVVTTVTLQFPPPSAAF